MLIAFADDAPARADRIERVLAAMHAASDESAREAAVDSLDFEAHSVSGAAATVALHDISAAARELERAVAVWQRGSAQSRDEVDTKGRRLVDLLRAVDPGALPPPAPAAPEGLRSSSAVILHIEDNVSNLKLVERIFDRRPEIELSEARTGMEGLALAAQLRPSLVVLDLRLPDMSGEDVLLQLRAEQATRDVPVVVVSAEARPTEADRMLAAGADDFIVKPIDVRSFLDVVDRLLARTLR